MAPFTPFFTEVLYQNLRKVSDGSEESIHYCSYPQEGGKVFIIGLLICYNICNHFLKLFLCSKGHCIWCFVVKELRSTFVTPLILINLFILNESLFLLQGVGLFEHKFPSS